MDAQDQVVARFRADSASFKLRTKSRWYVDTDSATTKIDDSPYDNIDSLWQIARSSYDPNKKTHISDSVSTPVNRMIEYMVQFQNTGNDTAYRVEVRDTLPDEVDLSTFEFLGSSHDAEYLIHDNKLFVYFEDINLPDSASNEAESQGSFRFRLHSKNTLDSTSIITNRVGIYFDINPPIITNIDTLPFLSPIQVDKINDSSFCAKDSVKIDFSLNFIPAKTGRFYLELSGADGSFNNTTVLDSLDTRNRQGRFSIVLLDSLKSSAKYQFRISSNIENAYCFYEHYSPVFSYLASSNGSIALGKKSICENDSLSLISSHNDVNVILLKNGQQIDSSSKKKWKFTKVKNGDNFQAVYTLTGQCYDSSNVVKAIVNPIPVAAFTSDTAACSPSWTINAKDLSTISSGSISSLSWNFGDGQSSTGSPVKVGTVKHTYIAAGEYDIELIAMSDSGCADTAYGKTTMYYQPIASFTLAKNRLCLETDTLDIVNTSANFGLNPFISWNFGDGSTSSDFTPTHAYKNTGPNTVQYVITYIIATSKICADTAQKSIVASKWIDPKFNLNNSSQCVNDNNFEADGPANLDSLRWKAGDGQSYTGTKFRHSYLNPGEYTIALTVWNGACESSYDQKVEVFESPKAKFVINNDSQCFGNHLFRFTNQSTVPGNHPNFIWDFGDTTQSGMEHPTKRYAQAGIKRISLIAKTENDCADTSFAEIYLQASLDTVVTVNDGVLTARNSNASYQWLNCDQGNAVIAQETQQSFKPAVNGNYRVELQVNGCTERSECHYVQATGSTNNQSSRSLKLYPNPSDGSVRIEADAHIKLKMIQVFDLKGRLLYEMPAGGMSTWTGHFNLVPGVYQLAATTHGGARLTSSLLIN